MTLVEMYVEKFGETFPIFGIRKEDSNRNIDDIIEECIKKGEPYKPEYKKGNVY